MRILEKDHGIYSAILYRLNKLSCSLHQLSFEKSGLYELSDGHSEQSHDVFLVILGHSYLAHTAPKEISFISHDAQVHYIPFGWNTNCSLHSAFAC